MLVPPAVKLPQFMEDKGIVHALSEYKPQLADVTTPPMEDTSGDLFTTSREDE